MYFRENGEFTKELSGENKKFGRNLKILNITLAIISGNNFGVLTPRLIFTFGSVSRYSDKSDQIIFVNLMQSSII